MHCIIRYNEWVCFSARETAQCALLRPWSNPKFENYVSSKANDDIKSVFTEKSPKYSLVFML